MHSPFLETGTQFNNISTHIRIMLMDYLVEEKFYSVHYFFIGKDSNAFVAFA